MLTPANIFVAVALVVGLCGLLSFSFGHSTAAGVLAVIAIVLLITSAAISLPRRGSRGHEDEHRAKLDEPE